MTDVRCVNSDFPKPSCGDTELSWQCQFAVSTSLAAGRFVLLQCPAPGIVLVELLQLPAGRGAAGSNQCPELLCKWCFGVIEKGVKCLAGLSAWEDRREENRKTKYLKLHFLQKSLYCKSTV